MSWTRTFGQMKTDLGTWLGVDKDASNPNYTRLPEDVREFLILQVRRWIYQRRDLRFFESVHTITTADGDYDYGLPADWGRPYFMWYKDSSTNKVVEIKSVTRAEWQDLYSEDAADRDMPTHYCVYGSNYYMTPTPDAVYTIYVDYFSEPADLTTDASYDDFLKHGWDAIFFEACVRGAAGYLIETKRLQYFVEQAKVSLNALSSDHARSRWSGRPLQNEIPG